MDQNPIAARRQQRYRRARVRVAARISSIDPETDPESGTPYFCSSDEICQNVSRGGAYIVTGEPFSPGRRLLVELEIPGGPPVQTIGRVAWSRVELEKNGDVKRSGIGIEFMSGTPDALRALERYVDVLLRRAHAAAATSASTGGRHPST
jgi:Tfp pilus assembly protein PilZ